MSAPNNKRQTHLKTLLAFDAALLASAPEIHGQLLTGVIGVDEVGRGSLVGPVVAAAFCFPILPQVDHERLLWLDDSKASHFNHARRVELAGHLKILGYWGMGEASQLEIETLNISKASLLAGYRAVQQLLTQFSACDPACHLVVMDGKQKIPDLPLCQQTQVKGDQSSAAVAAASILAKAYRDEMMIGLSADYPGYGWESNAGYPTPSHQAALHSLGVTPLHRKTYKVVQEVLGQQQLLLF